MSKINEFRHRFVDGDDVKWVWESLKEAELTNLLDDFKQVEKTLVEVLRLNMEDMYHVLCYLVLLVDAPKVESVMDNLYPKNRENKRAEYIHKLTKFFGGTGEVLKAFSTKEDESEKELCKKNSSTEDKIIDTLSEIKSLLSKLENV